MISTNRPRAVIFVPQGNPNDSHFADLCLGHIEEHHYRFFTVAWNWNTVLAMFAQDLADVCVMARREHLDPSWTPRVEFVGDDNDGRPRPRPKSGQRNAGRNRDRRPRLLN